LFLKKKLEPWLDEGTLWTTEEALETRRRELRELQDIRLPTNAKAIGAAAAHGDLSENSEWQYAMEEKHRLEEQINQLQLDLAKTRVIVPDDVPTDSVGIGSKVTLHGDDGATIEMTFLGPWESDLDKRIYSYRSGLAQSLMGQPVGASVMVKIDGREGTYTIEAVASAL
jgi:transcription elongation factor GreB